MPARDIREELVPVARRAVVADVAVLVAARLIAARAVADVDAVPRAVDDCVTVPRDIVVPPVVAVRETVGVVLRVVIALRDGAETTVVAFVVPARGITVEVVRADTVCDVSVEVVRADTVCDVSVALRAPVVSRTTTLVRVVVPDFVLSRTDTPVADKFVERDMPDVVVGCASAVSLPDCARVTVVVAPRRVAARATSDESSANAPHVAAHINTVRQPIKSRLSPFIPCYIVMLAKF